MKRENVVAFLPYYLLVVILALGTAVGCSGVVTVFGELQPVELCHCIIIDAGHGGVDGGATSCTGVLESQLNLQIALRLEDLLHLLGYRTQMIRTENVSIYTQGDSIAAKKVSDLKERVRIVNETEGALLISIHQNTFSDSRYGGAQVFYAQSEGSKALADRMQNSLISALNPNSNRQAKRGEGIYLMEHIQATGILIECGFLSNPEEEAKLRSDSYQKQLCCVIAGVISHEINA